MALHSLVSWQPFHVDALGSVTLLGADEMQKAVGRLSQSCITEWLPLLAAYTVASDQILQAQSGFTLYNIIDGVVATDLSSWFTRWLASYPITYTATRIVLRNDGSTLPAMKRSLAVFLGLLSTLPLFILAVVMRDIWGCLNVSALLLSVICRQGMVSQLRSAMDQTMCDFSSKPADAVKVFVTLPDGRAVTIYGSRSTVVNSLLKNPRPANPLLYKFLRGLGWVSFGVHAIALEMATLVNQILAVAVLLGSSLLVAQQAGEVSSAIGGRLRLEVDVGTPEWSRSAAYSRLNMSQKEEDCLVHWNLSPQKTNTFWWDRYRKKFGQGEYLVH
jgi:hypothetical protein